MKVLYVANDARSAQLAGVALQKIGRDVSIEWAGGLPDALRWIHGNMDLAALLVESHVQNQGCASFIGQVRALGLTVPIIVVSSDTDPPFAELKAGADDFIVEGQSLDVLPGILSRALQREVAVRSAKGPTRILYVGNAAFARECLVHPGSPFEITETVPVSNKAFEPVPKEIQGTTGLPFDVLLIEHGYPGVDTFAILRDVTTRKLQVPVVLVVEWDEDLIIPALKLGATDYVARTKASFQALSFRLHRLSDHSALVREQAELQAAQRFLLSVIDGLPLYLVRLAYDGTVLDVSTAGLAAFGAVGRRAMLGSSFYTYIAEADKYAVRTMIESARFDTPSAAAEFQIVTPDGGHRILKTRTARRTQGERSPSIVCIFEDVTERHEWEQKQREREAQTRQLAEGGRSERQRLEAELESARVRADELQREHLAARIEWDEHVERLKTAHAADAAAQAKLVQQNRETLSAASETERRLTLTVKSLLENQERLQKAVEAETSSRKLLEQKVAESEAAAHSAEQRYASQLTNAAAKLAEHQTRYAAGLAAAAADRDALGQQLRELEKALEDVRRERLSLEAAGEQFARRESEIAALLAETRTSRDEFERRATDAEAALIRADERMRSERAAAEEHASRRVADLEALLDEDRRTREALEGEARTAAEALQRATQESTSQAAAFGEHIARQSADFAASLAEATRDRAAFEQRITDLGAAVEEARRGHSETADQLSRRNDELATTRLEAEASRRELEHRLAGAMLELEQARADRANDARLAAEELRRRDDSLAALEAEAQETRKTYEQRLAEAASARDRAAVERQNESRAATEQLARRNDEIAASRAETQASREAFERRLADASALLERARVDRENDARASAEELGKRGEELAVVRAETSAMREVLERRLAEALATLDQARADRAHDAAAAAESLAKQEANLTAARGELQATREASERRLADASALLERARVDRENDARASAEELGKRGEELAAVRAETSAIREALERRLAEALATLDQARADRANDAAAAQKLLARYETDLTAARADATATQQALEHRLQEGEAAREQVEQALTSERHLSEELSSRLENVQSTLTQETTRRESLERDLSTLSAEAANVEQRLVAELDAVRRSTVEREAQIAEASARDRAEREHEAEEAQGRITALQGERDALQSSLTENRQQLEIVSGQLKQERDQSERARVASQAETAQLNLELEAIRQTLDHVRTNAQQTLERVSREAAVERVRLEALLAERQAELQEQAIRQAAAEEAARKSFADLDDRLRLEVEARDKGRLENEQLQGQLTLLGQQQDATRGERDRLRVDVDRLSPLQGELDEARAERERQLNLIPCGVGRCSREGTLDQVNQALVSLLGYRSAEELRSSDFGSVFDDPDELPWLIDRCFDSQRTESTETMWKDKDGRRLVVRLLARAATADAIEIVAEDVTALRSVEERLRHAQRMEAVARLSSEVAVTCENVLNDVARDGQQWLSKINNNESLRHQGELLLAEVARAASFLHQLSVYGKKETAVPETVNMGQVLVDLAPVLKRVVGETIELVRPKNPAQINVDVDAERVERVLINVAAYGRQRMPFGGQMRIELSMVTVNRQFIERYPNVRPGVHALVTVTMARRSRTGVSIDLRDESLTAGAGGTSPDQPGVDLGSLQALIHDCGGHLWMTAEADGDMVLKVHLPQRILDRVAEGQPTAARRDRMRWMRRLAGSKSSPSTHRPA